jgi:hypothetical protein
MAWETRNGKGRYYTRSERVDGRVKRTYVGTGELAEIAAGVDVLGRAALTKRATALERERQQLQARDDAIADLHADGDLLVRAALVAAGYHRHDRGAWRRRRG